MYRYIYEPKTRIDSVLLRLCVCECMGDGRVIVSYELTGSHLNCNAEQTNQTTGQSNRFPHSMRLVITVLPRSYHPHSRKQWT